MNIFEKATRQKTRFETEKGHVGVEELWAFPLEKLNEMGVKLNKVLSESGQFTLLPTAAAKAGETENQLKLDILKHIITTRVQEKEAASQRAVTQAKLAQLKDLAVQKTNEALSQQSLADLQKQIDALEATLV